jgi:uncharacterized protein YndB with AHSA1/START domain
MTSQARPGDRILGSLRSNDGMGVARMEERFDTNLDDVWSALTDPPRLAAWYGTVDGDLRMVASSTCAMPAGNAPDASMPASLHSTCESRCAIPTRDLASQHRSSWRQS